ncbi:MAG: YdcF family protein [Sneathiella sp.]|nr:YdcF family protein [Sneathiella sp.]
MKNSFSRWLKCLAVLSFVWVGAFLFFVQEVTGPKFSNSQSADGIVILTGTPKRLEVGFDLLKSGAGKRVLISGVNKNVSREQLRLAMGESIKIMTCCVDLGRKARDTVGNAKEAFLWANKHKFDELLIVTSAYHMPRSLIELKRKMPRKSLYAVASRSDPLKLETWWKNPFVTYVLAAEFNKYLVSLIRARLEQFVMDGDIT